MRIRLLVSAALLTASQAALADSVELDINKDTLRAIYAHRLDVGYQGLEMDLGYLYKEDKGANDVITASLFVGGDEWTDKGTYTIRMGGRAMLATPDAGDVVAVGLGGKVRYNPPEQRWGVSVEGYYAPKILAFGDGEEALELGGRVDYRVLVQAVVYAGYRHIEVDTTKVHNITLDDEAHIGMQLLF